MSEPRVNLRWKWKRPNTSPEWKKVLTLPGLTDELVAQGEGIVAEAKQTAPYDDRPNRPEGKPHYRDNFVVVVHKGKKRNTARVGNTVPHSIFVEFGGDRTPDYHTLERAAAARGIGITEVE